MAVRWFVTFTSTKKPNCTQYKWDWSDRKLQQIQRQTYRRLQTKIFELWDDYASKAISWEGAKMAEGETDLERNDLPWRGREKHFLFVLPDCLVLQIFILPLDL